MKKFTFFTLLLLFTVVQLTNAQKQWDEIEYPEINNFEKPDIEIFELSNGIRFYLVEDDELPLINLRAIVKTGGILVPNEKAGLHSIAGNVMRTGGTETYPGEELNELLENRAARMEISIGFTSGSASMNVLKEDFDNLIPVFVDLLENPAFPEDKIELAKTQQKSSISRRNDDQSNVANREFRRLIYGPESVYGRNTEYETVDNISRQDLAEFHEKSFVGHNLMIGVIGDFNTAEMKQTLQEAFGDFPAGEELELNFPDPGYQFEPSINFVDKRDVNQSYILMGHIGGMRDNPDYAKLQLMNRILSGGFSGRLFRIVRSDMGLAYAVFGSYESNNFYPGVFRTGVMTQSSTTAEAIDAIIEQIERLQNEPVTEEELQQTKDRFLNSLVFQYDSRASVLNERMNYDYAGLPEDTFDRLVEEIRAVSVEDVQQVAREYLRPDALEILVVGHGEEIGDQLEKYGEVNEVDITIPEPADETEDVAGDTALGKQWLTEMSEAILPGGDISGINIESTNTVNTPQGPMELNANEKLNFAEGTFISEISTPMGMITSEVTKERVVQKMGGQERELPPAQAAQTRAEYERHYLNVALNVSNLEAEFLGETEKADKMLVQVRVQMDSPVTYYLDPETALPVIAEYRQMNPQIGQRVTVETHFSEWQIVDGVALPYQSKSYVDGEEQSSTTIKSHSTD